MIISRIFCYFKDIFGEAMIAAAREWEGWRKHRETLRAWTLLISFLVDRMRQGYESTVRRPGMIHQYSVVQNHSHDDDADDNAADDEGAAESTSKNVEASNNDEDQINCAIDEENVQNENSMEYSEGDADNPRKPYHSI